MRKRARCCAGSSRRTVAKPLIEGERKQGTVLFAAEPTDQVKITGDGGVYPLRREARYAVFTVPLGTHVFEVKR